MDADAPSGGLGGVVPYLDRYHIRQARYLSCQEKTPASFLSKELTPSIETKDNKKALASIGMGL